MHSALPAWSFVLALCGLFCSSVQAATLTNPSQCDFDGDQVVDTISVEGRKGTAILSKTSRTVSVRFAKAYKFITCKDTNKDKKAEILGKMKSNGSGVAYFVLKPAQSGSLLKVCRKVRELARCEIWKSKQSHHISRGDPRQRSTGFITTRACPGGFPNPIIAYDSKGTQIHKLGEYFPTGSAYDSRYYGCFAAGDCKSPTAIAAEAKRRTGKEDIYLKDLSGNCARVPDPGQCYNSSGC